MQFHCRAQNLVHCRLCKCIYTIERYLAPALSKNVIQLAVLKYRIADRLEVFLTVFLCV